jgi:hypothetical protein
MWLSFACGLLLPGSFCHRGLPGLIMMFGLGVLRRFRLVIVGWSFGFVG